MYAKKEGDNIDNQIDSLAAEVIRMSRNSLAVNLRFMDAAIFRFEPEATLMTDSIATNGCCFLYNPIHVLKCYRAEKEQPVRSFLHMVLHCVFCHMFVGAVINRLYWNLACDIAVEYTISCLNLQSVMTSKQKRQEKFFENLQKELKTLTAEHIYRYFLDTDLSASYLDELQSIFCSDDHCLWYADSNFQVNSSPSGSRTTQDSKSESGIRETNDSDSDSGSGESQDGDSDSGSSKSQDSDSDSGSGESQDGDTDSGSSKTQDSDSDSGSSKSQDGDSDSGSSKSQDGNSDYGSDESKDNDSESGNSKSQDGGTSYENKNTPSREQNQSMSSAEAEQLWREVAHRIQVDTETFSYQQGSHAGGMIQNLREVNREKYDYTSFLKKFAVLGEVMKINEDEFDYVFYTYGLQLYKRMPLIEPLEYKEVKRIKEFVIAIDTSGSVSGELVQKFVQKTYNILLSTESFFSKINVHIIQCDADIQEDKKITCREEFDEYLKTMKIRGLGGTDFRPVFDYVNKLQTEKEFTNLKGLIYFTDGYGDFPSQKPAYNTAFVFVDDEYDTPHIPPWAIKLVLTKEEI